MAYINYKILYENGLSDRDYHNLIKISQTESVLLEGLDIPYDKYEELGFIEYTKANKSHKFLSVRLSKKGRAFLSSISTYGTSDDIERLVDSLIELYGSFNKETGNKLEIRERLIWFIGETGFNKESVEHVVEEYLNSTDEYCMKLDNLIWKPQASAFSIHKNLKNSKLFDLMCDKYKISSTFYTEKRNTLTSWLFDISRLKIPKSIDQSLYFTGSYKSDIAFKTKMSIELRKQLKKI